MGLFDIVVDAARISKTDEVSAAELRLALIGLRFRCEGVDPSL
jgi:hypothetical protein